MATQPFDPTVLAAELKRLGAASNITEKLKSDWSDISKNLSEQEKNQRRLNILSSLQSDISATISEQKKASIVYDEASFNLEKRKLGIQQEEIYFNIRKQSFQYSRTSILIMRFDVN